MSVGNLAELVFAGLTLISALLIIWIRVRENRANRSRLGLLLPIRLTLGAILAASRGAKRS